MHSNNSENESILGKYNSAKQQVSLSAKDCSAQGLNPSTSGSGYSVSPVLPIFLDSSMLIIPYGSPF